MKAVYFNEKGGPQVLKVGEVHQPIPEDNEVLIKVAAAGVNREDLIRRGNINSNYHYPDRTKSPYLGYECSGEVISTGSKVLSCKKGDKVCAFLEGGGGYAEVVAVPAIFVVAIPTGIPLTHAASLPQATCFTLWCLSELLEINFGQKILIHGGAGGFGSIAIQYANYMGCDVYATARNKEQVQLCQELGAKLCINYKTEDFRNRVKVETKGKGVDIIVDVAGERYLKKSLDCLSLGGSLIIIDKGTVRAAEIDLHVLLQKKISVVGASLARVPSKDLHKLLTKAKDLVWPLIAKGCIRPIIGKVFKFSEAAKAHTAMENSAVPAKILLVP